MINNTKNQLNSIFFSVFYVIKITNTATLSLKKQLTSFEIPTFFIFLRLHQAETKYDWLYEHDLPLILTGKYELL